MQRRSGSNWQLQTKWALSFNPIRIDHFSPIGIREIAGFANISRQFSQDSIPYARIWEWPKIPTASCCNREPGMGHSVCHQNSFVNNHCTQLHYQGGGRPILATQVNFLVQSQ
jgi:hypothetical protein